MKKIPAFLQENGQAVFFNEDEYGKQAFQEDNRVIRTLNGKRTHNISRDGNALFWENNDSVEGEFVFPTEAQAIEWWESRFKNCAKWGTAL